MVLKVLVLVLVELEVVLKELVDVDVEELVVL